MVIEGTKEEARIRKSFCSFNEREFRVKTRTIWEYFCVRWGSKTLSHNITFNFKTLLLISKRFFLYATINRKKTHYHRYPRLDFIQLTFFVSIWNKALLYKCSVSSSYTWKRFSLNVIYHTQIIRCQLCHITVFEDLNVFHFYWNIILIIHLYMYNVHERY